jgi:hypothetical protein
MNPLLIIVLGVLVLAFLSGNGTSPRPQSRSEAFAGCAMTSHPTQREIADCHAWQAEKERAR